MELVRKIGTATFSFNLCEVDIRIATTLFILKIKYVQYYFFIITVFWLYYVFTAMKPHEPVIINRNNWTLIVLKIITR